MPELRIASCRQWRHSIKDQFTSWHLQDGASEVLHPVVPSGIHGNVQITQLNSRQRFVAIACLKLWHLYPATGTHSILRLSVATRRSKGPPSDSHSKTRHWLFSVWLTSSIMCWHTFTNLFLNVKSLTTMRLITKRGEAAHCRTFFHTYKRTSSTLLRFCCSVLDSAADLTFDPLSARFSSGTQPRSVMQQNQNNKAQLHRNQTVPSFMHRQINAPTR